MSDLYRRQKLEPSEVAGKGNRKARGVHTNALVPRWFCARLAARDSASVVDLVRGGAR